MHKRFFPGMKINMLTLIEYVGRAPSGNYQWKVRCDCGREYITHQISFYRNKSCGCLKTSPASRIGEKVGIFVITRFHRNLSNRSVSYYVRCPVGHESTLATVKQHNQKCFHCCKEPPRLVNREPGSLRETEIKQLTNQGFTMSSIAKDLGLSKQRIHQIVREYDSRVSVHTEKES